MNIKNLLLLLTGFACIANSESSFSSQIKTIGDKAGSQFEQLKTNLGFKEKPQRAKLDQLTLQDIVSFLSKSPDYRGKLNLQNGFLKRLQLTTDISERQKENILNMVTQRELRDKAEEALQLEKR
jgi:hypothetical protein